MLVALCLDQTQENPARIDEKWTPEKSGITETIPALTEGSVQDYKNLMEAWNGDGNSCSKFSSIYGGLYKVRKSVTFSALFAAFCVCEC